MKTKMSDLAYDQAYADKLRRRNARVEMAGLVIAAVVILGAIVFAVWPFPVPEQRALNALTASGYTEAVLGGVAPMRCGTDKFTRSFSATSPTGDRVSGVVCCSPMKACSVRF